MSTSDRTAVVFFFCIIAFLIALQEKKISDMQNAMTDMHTIPQVKLQWSSDRGATCHDANGIYDPVKSDIYPDWVGSNMDEGQVYHDYSNPWYSTRHGVQWGDPENDAAKGIIRAYPLF